MTGFVHQVKYNPMLDAAFVWVGPTSADTVLCYIQITVGDDESTALVKSSMIDGLTAAMLGGRSVTLSTDDDNPSAIESAAIHPVTPSAESPA
ncbi:MAG TPA: hypothetical protein VF516_37320 [Kofleriaceae bacterium]